MSAHERTRLPAASHADSTNQARSLRSFVAAVVIATFVLSGCGSSHGRAETTDRTQTVTEPATTAATHAPATNSASVPSGSTTKVPTTQTGPAERVPRCDAVSGTIDLPGGPALVRSPATDHRRAAVVMLHGYTATPEGEETVSGWTAFLEGTDTALVYPEGNPTSSGGYGWTTGTDRFSTSGTDDIARISRMLDWLVDQNCVDTNQILIAGESNGSAMGLLLACSGRLPVEPRLFALAIPAVDEHVTDTCADSAAVPLIVFAGRLDATVPYDGTPGDPDAPVAPKAWFTSLIPNLQNCGSAIPKTQAVPDGTRLTYPGCARTTAFFTIDDGHHTWPGGPSGAGGVDPGVFPASRVAWCASGLVAKPPPVADCATVLRGYLFPTG